MNGVATPAAAARTGRPSRPRSLACPNCGAPITIRASGISVTAACPACGSVLGVGDETVQLVTNAQQRTRTPLIAIGARGTLADTEWEVIGYQERSSEQGSWRWEEYLLFNPYQGFRFLGQDHGHWTLYAMLRQAVAPGGVVAGDPHRYREDFSGVARTEYVLGEFYWRVRVGDSVAVKEFVDAPYVLSEERADGEVTWSRGLYLEPPVVQAAFNLKQMPARVGRVAHQPVAASARSGRLWLVASMAIALLVVLHSVGFGRDHNRIVFEQSFTASARNPVLSSASFDIPGAGGNLMAEIAPANRDNWLQFDLALINAAGDRQASQTFTAAPYFGDEQGDNPSVTFAAIPGGSYKLLVTSSVTAPGTSTVFPPPAPANAPDVDVRVTLWRHPPAWGDFWAALLALLAWPSVVSLVRWFRRMGAGSNA